MELFRQDAKRLPYLFLGFVLLALGIQLTRISGLGLASWGVFHEGVSNLVPWMNFGITTQIVGLIILTFSVLALKSKVGIGTILNVAVIGPVIIFYESIFPEAITDPFLQWFVLVIGILFTTLGRSLYIASRLGPGPRDGLFVGLARVTKFQVKYVKITIELIVLGVGFALGGTVGIGTIILMVASGYLVQFFFKVFNFDPKTVKQSDLTLYFKTR